MIPRVVFWLPVPGFGFPQSLWWSCYKNCYSSGLSEGQYRK